MKHFFMEVTYFRNVSKISFFRSGYKGTQRFLHIESNNGEASHRERFFAPIVFLASLVLFLLLPSSFQLCFFLSLIFPYVIRTSILLFCTSLLLCSLPPFDLYFSTSLPSFDLYVSASLDSFDLDFSASLLSFGLYFSALSTVPEENTSSRVLW